MHCYMYMQSYFKSIRIEPDPTVVTGLQSSDDTSRMFCPRLFLMFRILLKMMIVTDPSESICVYVE